MTEKKSSQYPFKFVPYEPTVDLREEDGFRRGPPGADGRGRGRGRGSGRGGRSSPPSLRDRRLIWRTDPGNWIAFPGFQEKAEIIYNFPLRPDDVWVVTPPKCGTTWTQELAWLLLHDLDFQTAKKVGQFYRSPFIDMGPPADESSTPGEELVKLDRTFENLPHIMENPIGYAQSLPIEEGPRLIKTHTALPLLPPDLLYTCKVIYVARNLKDACVSLYHHAGNTGDFKIFAKSFRASEQFPGDWMAHMLEAWNKRNNPNLIFIWYEDLKKDLPEVVRRLAKFLNKSELVEDEDRMKALLSHLDFKNFKENKSVNKSEEVFPGMKEENKNNSFIRKGIVGDWKNYFDDETSKEWDQWIESTLAGSGMKMIFA